MQHTQGTRPGDDGYAMVTLLVAMALMAVFMSAALPAWRHATLREKEAELIWRGEQYDRAVQLFRRKFAAPGPPNLDILLEQRFLRKKYKDPITGGDFEVKAVNPGGVNLPPGTQQPRRAEGQLIGGVRSKSRAKSIKVLNGRDRYDQWEFTYVPYNPDPQPAAGPTTPGVQPGQTGGPGSARPGSRTPGSSRTPGASPDTPRPPSDRN